MSQKSQIFEREELLLLEEYKQIGDNLRLGWNYIFNFFRYFIFLQIVLISIIGLGKSAIYSPVLGKEIAKQITKAEQLEVDQKDIESSNEKNDSKKNNSDIINEFNTKNSNWKKIFLFILSALGAVYSLGGILHNKSIFEISKNFVGRADAIETRLWELIEYADGSKSKGELSSSKKINHEPHHIYMNNRFIELDKKFISNIRKSLFALYSLTFALWLLVLGSPFIPQIRQLTDKLFSLGSAF